MQLPTAPLGALHLDRAHCDPCRDAHRRQQPGERRFERFESSVHVLADASLRHTREPGELRLRRPGQLHPFAEEAAAIHSSNYITL